MTVTAISQRPVPAASIRAKSSDVGTRSPKKKIVTKVSPFQDPIKVAGGVKLFQGLEQSDATEVLALRARKVMTAWHKDATSYLGFLPPSKDLKRHSDLPSVSTSPEVPLEGSEEDDLDWDAGIEGTHVVDVEDDQVAWKRYSLEKRIMTHRRRSTILPKQKDTGERTSVDDRDALKRLKRELTHYQIEHNSPEEDPDADTVEDVAGLFIEAPRGSFLEIDAMQLSKMTRVKEGEGSGLIEASKNQAKINKSMAVVRSLITELEQLEDQQTLDANDQTALLLGILSGAKAASQARNAKVAATMKNIVKTLAGLNWPSLRHEFRNWVKRSAAFEQHVRDFLGRVETDEMSELIDVTQDSMGELLTEYELKLTEELRKFLEKLIQTDKDLKANQIVTVLIGDERKAETPVSPLSPKQETKAERDMTALLNKKASQHERTLKNIQLKKAVLHTGPRESAKLSEEARPEVPVQAPSAVASGDNFDIHSLDEARYGHLKRIYFNQEGKLEELRKEVDEMAAQASEVTFDIQNQIKVLETQSHRRPSVATLFTRYLAVQRVTNPTQRRRSVPQYLLQHKVHKETTSTASEEMELKMKQNEEDQFAQEERQQELEASVVVPEEQPVSDGSTRGGISVEIKQNKHGLSAVEVANEAMAIVHEINAHAASLELGQACDFDTSKAVSVSMKISPYLPQVKLLLEKATSALEMLPKSDTWRHLEAATSQLKETSTDEADTRVECPEAFDRNFWEHELTTGMEAVSTHLISAYVELRELAEHKALDLSVYEGNLEGPTVESTAVLLDDLTGKIRHGKNVAENQSAKVKAHEEIQPPSLQNRGDQSRGKPEPPSRNGADSTDNRAQETVEEDLEEVIEQAKQIQEAREKRAELQQELDRLKEELKVAQDKVQGKQSASTLLASLIGGGAPNKVVFATNAKKQKRDDRAESASRKLVDRLMNGPKKKKPDEEIESILHSTEIRNIVLTNRRNVKFVNFIRAIAQAGLLKVLGLEHAEAETDSQRLARFRHMVQDSKEMCKTLQRMVEFWTLRIQQRESALDAEKQRLREEFGDSWEEVLQAGLSKKRRPQDLSFKGHSSDEESRNFSKQSPGASTHGDGSFGIINQQFPAFPSGRRHSPPRIFGDNFGVQLPITMHGFPSPAVHKTKTTRALVSRAMTMGLPEELAYRPKVREVDLTLKSYLRERIALQNAVRLASPGLEAEGSARSLVLSEAAVKLHTALGADLDRPQARGASPDGRPVIPMKHMALTTKAAVMDLFQSRNVEALHAVKRGGSKRKPMTLAQLGADLPSARIPEHKLEELLTPPSNRPRHALKYGEIKHAGLKDESSTPQAEGLIVLPQSSLSGVSGSHSILPASSARGSAVNAGLAAKFQIDLSLITAPPPLRAPKPVVNLRQKLEDLSWKKLDGQNQTLSVNSAPHPTQQAGEPSKDAEKSQATSKLNAALLSFTGEDQSARADTVKKAKKPFLTPHAAEGPKGLLSKLHLNDSEDELPVAIAPKSKRRRGSLRRGRLNRTKSGGVESDFDSASESGSQSQASSRSFSKDSPFGKPGQRRLRKQTTVDVSKVLRRLRRKRRRARKVSICFFNVSKFLDLMQNNDQNSEANSRPRTTSKEETDDQVEPEEDIDDESKLVQPYISLMQEGQHELPADEDWIDKHSNAFERRQLLARAQKELLRVHGSYKEGWIALSVPCVTGRHATRGSFLCGLRTLDFKEKEAMMILKDGWSQMGVDRPLPLEFGEKECMSIFRAAEPITSLMEFKSRLHRKFALSFEALLHLFDQDSDRQLSAMEFAELSFSVGGSMLAAKRMFAMIVENSSQKPELGPPKIDMDAFLLAMNFAEGLEEVQRIRWAMADKWSMKSPMQVLREVPVDLVKRTLEIRELNAALHGLGIFKPKTGVLIQLARKQHQAARATVQAIVLRLFAGCGHHLQTLASMSESSWRPNGSSYAIQIRRASVSGAEHTDSSSRTVFEPTEEVTSLPKRFLRKNSSFSSSLSSDSEVSEDEKAPNVLTLSDGPVDEEGIGFAASDHIEIQVSEGGFINNDRIADAQAELHRLPPLPNTIRQDTQRPQTSPNVGFTKEDSESISPRRPITSWRRGATTLWTTTGLSARFAPIVTPPSSRGMSKERERQFRLQQWAQLGLQIGALSNSSPVVRQLSGTFPPVEDHEAKEKA